jgi:hypothetical protein
MRRLRQSSTSRIGTIRSRLSRGRESLRTLMDEEMERGAASGVAITSRAEAPTPRPGT